jgi:diacylglycerol kinase family enzyme
MASDAIAVIVNAGSGGGNDQALVDRLAGHFETAGLHAEIELAHGGDEIATAVGNAVARQPRLIVAGLGLYPDIVRDRERQQKRFGRAKWVAFASALLAALRRFPFLGVKLVIDGKEVVRRTPFVFIGNNEYRMEGFAIGERSGMDHGLLSLYVAQRPGRWRLLQLALRALTGHLRQARDFDAVLATDIVVQSRKKRLRVATDGEVTVMAAPLHYRVRPASLIVMRPRINPAT